MSSQNSTIDISSTKFPPEWQKNPEKNHKQVWKYFSILFYIFAAAHRLKLMIFAVFFLFFIDYGLLWTI